MDPQPLGYQQQDSSCWITSMINGLVYLLKDGGKIPNIIARIMYVLSSRDGTSNKEAEKLIKFIDKSELKIECKKFIREKATIKLIETNLNSGAVIVADTLSGSHSVLITSHTKDQLKVFDTDWRLLNRHKNKRNKDYNCEFKEPHYNVEVSKKEFFKKTTRKDSFVRMGAVSDRFIVVMKCRES